MKNYKLAIANDHSGVKLKNTIVQFLEKHNINCIDLGSNNNERVDYPDYAYQVVEKIIDKSIEFGILICSTGIGMSITANRSSKIRAALCTTEFMAERARLHNNANILILGSEVISEDTALKILDNFLNTDFEGGRHASRLSKIT